jgi:uncharacterized membrane protein YcaP (DUF421 family)
VSGLIDFLTRVDLRELFVPDASLPEVVLRISIVYLVLFTLLRVVVKREVGSMGITDLLVVVLVADAVQNAMAGQYKSITDGLILAAVLVFWDWFLTYAAYRWRGARKLIRPAPLLLVRDGRVIHANLRQELVTEEELESEIRLQGVMDVQQVAYAFLETDGRVSVIPRKQEEKSEGNDKPKGLG